MIKDFVKNNKESTWIEYIIQNLQGTCNGDFESLKEEYIKMGFNEDNLLLELDNNIFLCTCGWWCDISEANLHEDEQICDDCFSEFNE